MGKKGWKNKRIWCVVIAAALLCVGTGGYLFFHVQAQGILTGPEEKVSQKVKDSKSQFLLFCRYMEALVAYRKFSGRDE